MRAKCLAKSWFAKACRAKTKKWFAKEWLASWREPTLGEGLYEIVAARFPVTYAPCPVRGRAFRLHNESSARRNATGARGHAGDAGFDPAGGNRRPLGLRRVSQRR